MSPIGQTTQPPPPCFHCTGTGIPAGSSKHRKRKLVLSYVRSDVLPYCSLGENLRPLLVRTKESPWASGLSYPTRRTSRPYVANRSYLAIDRQHSTNLPACRMLHPLVPVIPHL